MCAGQSAEGSSSGGVSSGRISKQPESASPRFIHSSSGARSTTLSRPTKAGRSCAEDQIRATASTGAIGRVSTMQSLGFDFSLDCVIANACSGGMIPAVGVIRFHDCLHSDPPRREKTLTKEDSPPSTRIGRESGPDSGYRSSGPHYKRVQGGYTLTTRRVTYFRHKKARR